MIFTVERPGVGDGRAQLGRHVRSLRCARGYTQEILARHSGVSADTVRRLERGSMSPSVDTVHKLCHGLGLRMSTLFLTFELDEGDNFRELCDLVAMADPRAHPSILRMVRALIDETDVLLGLTQRPRASAR